MCEAKRYRYKNNDMADLECKLNRVPENAGCLIVTVIKVVVTSHTSVIQLFDKNPLQETGHRRDSGLQ